MLKYGSSDNSLESISVEPNRSCLGSKRADGENYLAEEESVSYGERDNGECRMYQL